jgi:hypothetical protein
MHIYTLAIEQLILAEHLFLLRGPSGPIGSVKRHAIREERSTLQHLWDSSHQHVAQFERYLIGRFIFTDLQNVRHGSLLEELTAYLSIDFFTVNSY